MSEERPPEAPRALSGRTAWARNLETPLRLFLRTETGSAVVLVGAAVAALVWINLSASSYAAVWEARLSVRLAGAGVSLSLREWVNSGLMTFFFFVFGLEARREFDMGELRQRRRLALPVAAGLGGLVVPVAIYLAVNHGSAARGWGAAMSTDTAFALGLLALTRPRFPDRVRAFLLSVAVVDDLVSLVVIGTAYSQAEPVLRELLAGHGDVRYVWRHLPLTDVHPDAQRAAEAAEAAADQGAFWPMHDLLLRHQDALLTPDLVRYATEVGIDPERFRARLASRADAARIAEDVDSADLSGVSGTPTFFINGRRHYGSYDITELTAAVRAAKAASLASAAPPTPRR